MRAPADPPAPIARPLKAGLRGRCPRCGQGALFDGFLGLAERCTACGLDFRAADPADGPAFFASFAVGALAVALAILVEVFVAPPLWVHALLWPVVVLGATLAVLRPLKGALVALQYRYRGLDGGPQDGPDGD